MLRFLSLLFICFLYIFGPVFNSVGPWADTIFFTSIFLILYNFLFSKHVLLKYITPFFMLLPLYFIACLIAGLTFDIRFAEVLNLLLKPLRIVITTIGGLFLVLLVKKKYGTSFVEQAINFIFYSIVLHAIIMIVQFVNTDFKDFIYRYTTNGIFTSFEYNFRMGGLSGAAGGSVLSVVQSLGIIILPFVKSNSLFEKVAKIVGFFLVIASVLICGRSGVLAILLFLPLAYMSVNKVLTAKFLSRIALIFFIIIGSLSALIIFVNTLPSDDPLSLVLNRTLDTYINFKESGDIQDQTTSQLLNNHLIFPDNFRIWIVGQPENLVNFGVDRTLNSDSGYIRDLWSFGIIGALLYTGPLLYLFCKILGSKLKGHAGKLTLILSIIFFVFNFKEPYFYVRMLWSIYSLLIACYYVNRTYVKAVSSLPVQS